MDSKTNNNNNLHYWRQVYLDKHTNEKTRKNYSAVLSKIPYEVDIEAFEKLIWDCVDKLSPTSAKQQLSVLKTFIKYYSQKTKDYRLMELEFPNITLSAKSKFIFSSEEIDMVKSFARTYDNSKGMSTLVIFLCENGARIGEALEILKRIEDWKQNENDNYYVVKPAFKKNNERAYIIRKESWILYEEIKSSVKKVYKSFDLVRHNLEQFINDFKTKYPKYKNVEITSHTFRRSYVTNQHEAGYSIVDIQKSTGHKDTSTLINSYILPTPEKLVGYVERASDPLRLKNITLNEMKKELNNLRDFREKALLNEKKYTARLELERAEKEEAILEVRNLKEELNSLKALLENSRIKEVN
ncbi:tyrosine-type recombinase/integrase [Mycoplasma sp. Z244C]